jgi:hypothetical protein
VRDEEQEPIGIAVHDARHGRILVLEKRVGDAGISLELGLVGHDLAVDGVALVLDQTRVVRGDLRLEHAGNLADVIDLQAESRGDLLRRPQAAPQYLWPFVHRPDSFNPSV